MTLLKKKKKIKLKNKKIKIKIIHGLRKCDNTNIKIKPTPRQREMIFSYEIAPLVHLTNYLSDVANQKVNIYYIDKSF